MCIPHIFKPLAGHDSLTHFIFAENFSKQFWQGNIYPRWLYDINNGLGGPVFLYFFPLQFWVTSFFSLIFNPWTSLLASCGLAFTIGGVGIYKLVSCQSYKPIIALLCALIYITSPYYFAIDFNSRFAFNELWGMALAPFLLFYFLNARFTGFAICVFLMVISHALSLYMMGVVLFILSFWQIKTIPKMLGAGVLGIGMAAFFLLPALTQQHLILPKQFSTGLFHYSKHFIFDNDLFKGFKINLEYTAIVTAIYFIISLIKSCNKIYWSSIIICIFLVTPYSELIWQNLPFIDHIQFPWRFLMPATILMVLCLSNFVKNYKSVAFVIIILNILSAHMAFKNQKMPQQYINYNKNNRTPSTEHLLPKWTSNIKKFLHPDSFKPVSEDFENQNYKTSAQVKSFQKHGNIFTINYIADKNETLSIKQFYFPYWEATLNGNKHDIYPNKNGILQTNLPSGEGELKIKFKPHQTIWYGWLISIFSFMFIFYKLIVSLAKAQKTKILRLIINLIDGKKFSLFINR